MEDNRSSVDSTGAEFSVMNINDFLAENNFDLGTVSSEDIFDEPQSRGQKDRSSIMRGNGHRNRHESMLSENSEILCQRETIAFCMQKARELGSKGKKKSVDKEKRPEWNFLQKNWHLQPFQVLILTQVIDISH